MSSSPAGPPGDAALPLVPSGGTPVGVAAFDFDGTLIRGDSLVPFLARAVGARHFARVVLVSSSASARAYRRNGRDGSKAVLVGRLLQGYPAAQLDALGASYGEQLATRIRPRMAERVLWHRRQGHRLVMVSASFELYLVPLGRVLGFDAVLATGLDVGPDGRLTGRLKGVNVRGPEKAVRLRHWLSAEFRERPYQLWAYGDSAGDRELLAMADHPVRV
ncbi:MAG TPA: HAD-IB family hydrolase [Acidimicrobiales bacterium]|nr:HAD-IB family hydrolase [Acidimicrobiales bacterium]